MRFICLALVFCLIAASAFAATQETAAKNFWQEFDITFWQTLPFAALWGHFFERQISSLISSGAPANWYTIGTFAVVVSAINANLHARRVIGNERTRGRN